MRLSMVSIDTATERAASEMLSRALRRLVRGVQTEIQDEGEFLLVRIEQDTDGQIVTSEIIDIAASILNALIPARSGEHAWMVNVERRGAVLDSEVGSRA
jgi:hypothetical protein